MTSTPEPAAPVGGTTGTPASHGAAAPRGSQEAHAHVAILTPLEESIRAIETTRRLLQEAVEHLDTGDDEQQVYAYEKSAECADHIAKALWFLRRLERERSG